MSELNNIDRLFKEKFKDFEATPSDKVWENIQSKMNVGEKETKFLPLWSRLCSFIAVFLIGFSLATTFIAGPFGTSNQFNKKTDDKPTAAGDPKTTDKEVNNTIVKSNSFERSINKNNAVVAHDKEDINISTSKNNNNSTGKNQGRTLSGETFSKGHLNSSKDSDSKPESYLSHNSNAASQTSAKKNTAKSPAFPSQKSLAIVDKNKAVASDSNSITTNTNNAAASKNSSSETNEIRLQNNGISEAYTDADAEASDFDSNFDPYANTSKVAHEGGGKYVQKKEQQSVIRNTGITVAESSVTSKVATKETSKSGNSKSTFNPKETTSTITIKDSTVTKQNKVAEGRDSKNETKKESEDKDSNDRNEKKSKWIVSTNFAPVYMNLNGSGSSLDSKFDGNSKSYQTSMSYGVGLKYALNKKWSVRTGVNLLNFEYSTNDISYYYSTSGTGLQYVNENGNGTGVVIENPDPKGIAYDENGIVTTRFKGNLNHKMNYVEVPVEFTYKILNRKLSIDAIAGMSSLFLNDNKVTVVSSGSSMVIGEANNLNKLHFSTNVGLGLSYSFLKNLHANIEPILKYQINTYDNNIGNFKPYFIGVYSGISYSF